MSKIESWLVPLLPESGRLALDVGANEGSCTEILAGRFSEVHAFEPNPQVANALRTVARRCMSVSLFELAISDGAGPVALTLYERSCHASAFPQAELDTPSRGESHATVRVPAASLDELGYPELPVDFLKIDTEGAELAVLEGAALTLREQGPALNVEVHSRANLDACRALVERAGYAPRHLPHPHAGVSEGHCWLICDRKERP